MKVIVDKDKCIMAGECYYNHPELFSMGDDGAPVVLVDELSTDELMRHASEAAEVCPALAITVVEKDDD